MGQDEKQAQPLSEAVCSEAEALGPKDVEVLQRTDLHEGFFHIQRCTFRHRLFAGGWSGEVVREIALRAPVAGVLPYDPEADAMVLISQVRLPSHLGGGRPWQLEIVAGIQDKDESLEDLAHRELQEEAGLTGKRLKQIAQYFPSPGGTTEEVTLFVAEVDSRGAGGLFGLDHEHEDILAKVYPCDEIWTRLDKGEIDNAMTLIALQWLRLNREALRREWGAAACGAELVGEQAGG